MWLTRLVVRRPVLLLAALGALVLLGLRAYSLLPAELDPRIELPVVNVLTIYPGASPAEVAREVSRPIEDAVSTTPNVRAVDSRSSESVSLVTVKLKLGVEVSLAAAEIRARVEAARRELPLDVEPPQVTRVDYGARPVMTLALTGPLPPAELRRLAEDEVRPRIGQAPGVGGIVLVGGLQREIQVRVDPQKLALHGLPLLDLLAPLLSASRDLPAGSLARDGGRVDVRASAGFGSLEELAATPVGRPPGAPPGRGPVEAATLLRLEDVAEVADTTARPQSIARVGRREAVVLVLGKLADANTVETARAIRRQMDLVRSVLPAGARLEVLQDHSIAVADALEDINATLVLGAFFAVLVVFIFLKSARETLIVASSIPISIILTFVVMYFAGFSLNQMTMLALSLSVGILVDDSILVIECINRRRALGGDPVDAALDGRAEIGLADAANTFVDVVVFLPIAFMGGIVGQFFREFGLTIATATLISLYVSFTLTPAMAARLPRISNAEPGPLAVAFEARYLALENSYRKLLGWALNNRLAVVGSGFAALALAGFVAWQVLPAGFTPSVDRGEVSVRLALAPGSSLESTSEVMDQVEAVAVSLPEVSGGRMLASVGEIVGGFGSLPEQGAELGQLTLFLQPRATFWERLLAPAGRPDRRSRSDEAVARDLEERLQALRLPVELQTSAVRGLSSSVSPVELGLYGARIEELEASAARVEKRLRELPMLKNVRASLRPGRPELEIRLDRERAEQSALTAAELGAALRTAVEGDATLRFRDGDESVPVRVLVDTGGGSASEEVLGDLLLARRGENSIHLDEVATFHSSTGPSRILRSRRVGQVLVSADLREGIALGEAEAAINRAMEEVELGGVEWRWEGDVNDMRESALLMAAALGLAVALSYLLLAGLFNNLLQPLAIMASVPMALVGGLLGLIYTFTPLNIVAMIGIVMLVGLVSKNAILLVDYTNTLRGRGLSREAALQEAGPVRLRPILMTTISTVLAMLPVALQIGRASELRSPMAIVVIGGLILSTLLTLVVTPVLYLWLDETASRFGRGNRPHGGADDVSRPHEAELTRVQAP